MSVFACLPIVAQSGWWRSALCMSDFPCFPIHLFTSLADGVRLFGCLSLFVSQFKFGSQCGWWCPALVSQFNFSPSLAGGVRLSGCLSYLFSTSLASHSGRWHPALSISLLACFPMWLVPPDVRLHWLVVSGSLHWSPRLAGGARLPTWFFSQFAFVFFPVCLWCLALRVSLLTCFRSFVAAFWMSFFPPSLASGAQLSADVPLYLLSFIPQQVYGWACQFFHKTCPPVSWWWWPALLMSLFSCPSLFASHPSCIPSGVLVSGSLSLLVSRKLPSDVSLSLFSVMTLPVCYWCPALPLSLVVSLHLLPVVSFSLLPFMCHAPPHLSPRLTNGARLTSFLAVSLHFYPCVLAVSGSSDVCLHLFPNSLVSLSGPGWPALVSCIRFPIWLVVTGCLFRLSSKLVSQSGWWRSALGMICLHLSPNSFVPCLASGA